MYDEGSGPCLEVGLNQSEFLPMNAESESQLDPVEDAVVAIAAGEMVVVVDDDDRENEGDLIVSAAKVTPEQMGFIVRHTTGIVCVPMPREAGSAAVRMAL